MPAVVRGCEIRSCSLPNARSAASPCNIIAKDRIRSDHESARPQTDQICENRIEVVSAACRAMMRALGTSSCSKSNSFGATSTCRITSMAAFVVRAAGVLVATITIRVAPTAVARCLRETSLFSRSRYCWCLADRAAWRLERVPANCDDNFIVTRISPRARFRADPGRSAFSYATAPAGAQRAVFQSCADAVCQSNA